MYFATMTAPSTSVTAAWTNLLRARDTALRAVEKALKAADLPPLAWYDVLLELERAGTDGLRPFQLQAALLLPQYRLSRLVERIAKAGLLTRRGLEADGRGRVLRVTTSGAALRRRMWAVYGPAINQVVGERLSDTEAAILSRLLKRLM